MLGKYHFELLYYNLDHTTSSYYGYTYNGYVKIPSPDDGNTILMTYPDSSHFTRFQTSDSSFTGGGGCGLQTTYSAWGNYAHDTLKFTDYSEHCSPNEYIQTIAVKY
jgi:hypothetical protein